MVGDPGEQNNLEATHREKVKEMVALLERIVDDGRSTPGEKQTNDVDVDIWKLDTVPAMDASVLDDY